MNLEDFKPIWRSERLKYAICTGDFDSVQDLVDNPQSREEEYLIALMTGDGGNIPKPVSRLDVYMYNTVKGINQAPIPISRKDQYWWRICKGYTDGLPEAVNRADILDKYLAEHSAFRTWETYEGKYIKVDRSKNGYCRNTVLKGNTEKIGDTLESVGTKEGKVILSSSNNEEEHLVEIQDLELGGVGNAQDTFELETGILTKEVGVTDMRTLPLPYSYHGVWYNDTSNCVMYSKEEFVGMDKNVFDILCDSLESFTNIEWRNGHVRPLSFTRGICNRSDTDEVIVILPNADTGVTQASDNARQLFYDYLHGLSSPMCAYYKATNPTTTQLTPHNVKSYEGTTIITTNNNVKADISTEMPIRA